MSKLLARAKVKYKNALNDYYQLSLDDAYVDDCCYNLQQCIEYCLKYIVELNGENYIENHDVRAQLNKLKELDVKLPFEEEIRKNASLLNSWEAESRYNDDFIALVEDINDIKELANRIIEYSDSLVQIK
ncbi:MAG: HEPN domain-containing protein [Erysipelotrichaceae bacterium]|nr:HEPN domain-containing protein [Erysipelotrichaceae bacterium]